MPGPLASWFSADHDRLDGPGVCRTAEEALRVSAMQAEPGTRPTAKG